VGLNKVEVCRCVGVWYTTVPVWEGHVNFLCRWWDSSSSADVYVYVSNR
jgi:hypothetical protein